MLPDYQILDPNVDRLPREALAALQSERLRHMVRYIYTRAQFWRRKFDAAGLRPEDIVGIEDLPKIPFCTRDELQQDQLQHPPFGSYVCSEPSTWRHYAATSGTTGRPLRRVLSARDFGYLLDRFRTRDLSRLATEPVCPACGFTGARLEGSIVGRVDDMIWYRGVNIFPGAIAEVLGRFGELGTEYRVIVTGDGALPNLAIRVETIQSLDGAISASLVQRIESAVRDAVRVHVAVDLLDPGTLPRADGRSKIRRVVDLRQRESTEGRA